ncbi:MAG: hypothetical protein ACI83B_001728 [Sediminicola sp.]|jgi:hypothetical protein
MPDWTLGLNGGLNNYETSMATDFPLIATTTAINYTVSENNPCFEATCIEPYVMIGDLYSKQ